MSLHKAWLSSAVQGRHAMLLNSSNEAQEISNMDLSKMPLYALKILTHEWNHMKNDLLAGRIVISYTNKVPPKTSKLLANIT